MNGSHENVAKRVNGHHGAINGAGAIETLRTQQTELVDELAQAMGMARDSLERPAATSAGVLHGPSPSLPAMPPPRHFFDDEDDDASMPIPSTWRNPPEPPPPTRTFSDQVRSAVLGFGVGLAIIVPTVLLMTGRLGDIDVGAMASMIPGFVAQVQEAPRTAPAPVVPAAVQQRTVATTTMAPAIAHTPAPAAPVIEQPVRPVEIARVEEPVVMFTPPKASTPAPVAPAPAASSPAIAVAPAAPEPTPPAPEPAATPPQPAPAPEVAAAPLPVPQAPPTIAPAPPQVAALPSVPPPVTPAAPTPATPTPAAIVPEPVAPPAIATPPAVDTTSTSPWASVVADSRQRIRAGDVAGGRQLLSRPVAAEDPDAILALAETYDPNMLAAWGVMASADVATARRLYSKALNAGVETARNRLKGLE